MANEEIDRIGEVLIDEGVVTQEELSKSVSESGVKGTALAAALESCKHPKRAELAAFLATDFNVPRLSDLRQVEFPADAAKLVAADIARRHELVPVGKLGGILCVAKANYYNRAAVQDVRRACGMKVKVLLADEAQVKAAIERVYAGVRAELPPPKGEKKDTVARRAAAPVPVGGDVPLISMHEERGPERPAVAAAKKDEALQILAAVRIPPAEYQAEERAPQTRLFREWDDLFLAGKPSIPIKVG